jgi:hypothetical protein
VKTSVFSTTASYIIDAAATTEHLYPYGFVVVADSAA